MPKSHDPPVAIHARDGLVVALDGGTEGVRAGLLEPDGRPVAFARASYGTDHPRQGWAEQDPNEWWSAAVQATRSVLAGIEPSVVKAIAVACTSCSMVACDANGTPLRPALIWMDVRAASQAHRIGETGDPALKYSGYDRTSAEWLLSKVLWLVENEPQTYYGARRIVEYTDWLTHRLTGEWNGNINTAAIRGYYDRDAGGWPTSLFETVGVPDLLAKLPEPILDMGETAGLLTADAAEALGLRVGIPVAAGGADAFVGMVGLNVLAPGRMALITGSSHLHLAQTLTPSYAPGMFGAYTDAVVPGQYTIEGGQVSTGSVVKWFRKLCAGEYFAGTDSGSGALTSMPPAAVYQHLQERAAVIPPGSDGVMALDFWQGNRTPYVDARARGMLWGLSLGHTPAHVYRALIEGVCFGTENILRTFARSGHEITEMVACGGAVNSDLWMQIHADVSNVPITVTQVPEAVTLGSAVLASVAAGLHPDIATAANSMVTAQRVIEPDPDAHETYQFFFDAYVASYEAMRDLMHEVVDHVSV